ncbi:hypothetical protein SAMN04487785_10367 [Dyella jiangningensis]|nr:hypothetical protein BDW41_101516 [Dyella sp. AtDHG13]SDJ64439.1 hypothetical protein SAMN04487785_10367 [Dyella jiangningensis]
MPTGFHCAYPPCRCYVDKPGEYCSAHCRQAKAAGDADTQCHCHHPACTGRAEEDQDGSAD